MSVCEMVSILSKPQCVKKKKTPEMHMWWRYKSASDWAMAWHQQAAHHYQFQCCRRSRIPKVPKLQWVNLISCIRHNGCQGWIFLFWSKTAPFLFIGTSKHNLWWEISSQWTVYSCEVYKIRSILFYLRNIISMICIFLCSNVR